MTNAVSGEGMGWEGGGAGRDGSRISFSLLWLWSAREGLVVMCNEGKDGKDGRVGGSHAAVHHYCSNVV